MLIRSIRYLIFDIYLFLYIVIRIPCIINAKNNINIEQLMHNISNLNIYSKKSNI